MKEKRWIKRALQFLCLFALALVLAVPAAGAKKVSAATKSGSCGESATYKYDSSSKTLTISGSGVVAAPDEWENISGSVKYLKVGNKITEIEASCFSGWGKLKSVKLGKEMTFIESSAFSECSSLTTVDMGSSAVTVIGSSAFYMCTKLKTVTFSKKLKKISSQAFCGCKKLTSVSLPSSLITIGGGAFWASGLEKITIPKKVTSIGSGVFYGCSSLKKIAVTSGNTEYTAISGVLYNKAKTKLIAYPSAKTDTSFTVPSSVKKICTEAFAYNKYLESVKIGSKVTEIEGYAFLGCEKLKTVVIGAKVKTIGIEAFADCSALTTVKFKGSAPTFEGNYDWSETGLLAFHGDTVTIKYPSSKKSSWKKVMTALSEDAESGYGKLTFKAY